MNAVQPNSVNFSLSRLLGGQGENLPRERYQDPTLQQRLDGVWFIRPWVDVITDGKLSRAKKTINLEARGKREAKAEAAEIMRTINRSDYVITSQIKLAAFVEEYRVMHVAKLAASSRGKYENHLDNHILPAFGKLMLCDLQPLIVQKWLDTLKKKGTENPLSWATKTDVRNVLSSIFSKAAAWGRWKDANPIENVSAGRKHAVREKRKLTEEQTRHLLAALPADLRLACCICLFCTLRVSEVLGLQEKHLDFTRGLILVRQRFYRGDLDTPKNDNARRDLPMGYLAADLKALCAGDPERFVFQVRTHPKWKTNVTLCRDDRDLNQHFLRPAAKALGFYYQGFGFHALRREAVTAISAALGIGAAMRMAGHGDTGTSVLYTLADGVAQDKAVRDRQDSIMGKTEKVN